MEKRKKDLLKLCDGLDEQIKIAIQQEIDEIVFLEDQLDELKKYPHIKVSARDPSKQRQTEAGKQYKDKLQQYNNCIKILLGVLNKVEATEESPLRQYLNMMRNKK